MTHIYRTLHHKAIEYTFFSSAHGTFSKIDHILGHKTALHKYTRIEIIPCILSDYNARKLEINHRKKSGKPPKVWRLKNTVLRMNGSTRQLEKNFKNIWKQIKMKIQQSKRFGM